jgi:hypothetical protein
MESPEKENQPSAKVAKLTTKNLEKSEKEWESESQK